MGLSPRKSSLGDMVKAVKQAETLHSTSFSEPLYYHLVTLHLFTLNDLKSILIPETICGILSALSGPLLTTNSSPALFAILARLPHVVLWNYLNLLIFDLANQRLITSLLEDSFNKPWRPLPSRRLSLVQTRRLLLSLIPIVVAATYFLGAVEETVLMLVLTWMYNDLHGADEHYLVRNIINAAGFMCYSSGSTRVAAGGQNTYNLNSVMLYQWTPLVGAVVLSTLQMQDMSDQEGDAQGDRGTLPLIWGDGVARCQSLFRSSPGR
ncbi:UbiA prenyltransferase family [Lasallia pustulata]|uniref:UbiA prenyltransferase family n=1 Tax=Lasallia pustulata TaxID=136370 RepID=A0A1W5D8E3_9LECA|nr:UbiA prenyltransferase family [Lasallia pustulata]